MRKSLLRLSKHAGYTLAELMVGVGIFAVGASIAYPLLVSNLNLYTRNFSINKSNNSLRHGLQMLKNDIDMAVEAPRLMTYTVNSGTGFGALAPSTNTASSDAILVWVNLGPAYDVVPTAGTGGTTGVLPKVNPTTSIKLNRAPASVLPLVGDRVIFLSPTPYSTGMPETVTMNGGSIQKPGRMITAVSGVSPTQFTVTLDQTRALPNPIPGEQSVYIVRETAFAAYTIMQGTTAVERQLVYYPNTTDMTVKRVLIRDLDPNPVTPDAQVATSVYAFNYLGGGSRQSALSVNLPIRALDYSNALGARSASTAGTEFNLFLRSNPQVSIKSNID